VQSAVTAAGEFVSLGLKGAIRADAKIIIRQQPLDGGDVIGELSLTPVQFQTFYFFVSVLMVGKNGMGLDGKCKNYYKNKGRSADRGK
jgi:hypothetical protein